METPTRQERREKRRLAIKNRMRVHGLRLVRVVLAIRNKENQK